MILPKISVAGLVTGFLLLATTPATADIIRDAVKDALKEEIREGVTTPARRTITNRVNPQRSTSHLTSSQRELNRETQTALNYFGFNTGTPDGLLGRRSRAAIADFQSYMGYPRTGRLTRHQRDFLVNSYYQETAQNPTPPNDPYQAHDRLLSYQDPAGVRNDPQPEQTAPASGLPTFMASGEAQTSLSSHCNQISLVTNANGGLATEATMTDPGFALEEQFCLARTYAIAQGEDMASGLENVSPSQLESECAAFGPTMQDYVTTLSLNPREQVIQDVSDFVLVTGMSPTQLKGTAKICLSVGYRTDNLDVAVGSALLLTALGEAAYNELLGHHLTQGYGTGSRPDLALDWYQTSYDAISDGARPVFAPNDPGRMSLIHTAALQLNGIGEPRSGALLPTFSLGSGEND